MHRFAFILAWILSSGLMAQDAVDTVLVNQISGKIANAQMYFKSNLDSALTLLEELRPEVMAVPDENLRAGFRLAQAQSMLYTEEYEDVIPLLQPNLDNRKSIDLQLQAETYRSIAAVYRQLWVPDSALKNFISALRLFEKAGYNRGISQTYLGLGLVYSKMGNIEMASDFYDRSIYYSENTEVIKAHKKMVTDQEDRPVSINQTLQLSFDILKIAEGSKDERMMSIAYNDIKQHYYQLGDYDNALKYAAKELEYRERTASKSLLSKSLWSVGEIYLMTGQPIRAVPLLERALPQATDSLRLTLYNDLKQAHRELGNLNEALGYSDRFNELKDSLDKKQNEKYIAEVMAEFQTEIQREQIKSLSVENELNESRISRQKIILFSTIGGAALLFFLGFLGYKNYRSNQQLKQSQLDSKLLRTQMNPHFVFNALNEIKLNLRDDNTEQTENYLNSYSRLMRLVLDSTTREFVPLKDEIELVSGYLELQQLVYDHSFDYQFEVDDDLDTNYLQVPPMFTQPFVENAIIHGVKGIVGGVVSVSYKMSEEDIIVEISDNGHGYDVGILEKEGGHRSHAMRNIQERIKAYEKLHNFRMEVRLESKPDSGTKVRITFPQKI